MFTSDILMSKSHFMLVSKTALIKSLLAAVEQLLKVQSRKEYYDCVLLLGTEVVSIVLLFLLCVWFFLKY